MTPTTEAGRALSLNMAAAEVAYDPDAAILAIEAEAAAAERERHEPYKVLGFTLRELEAAIATADMYHPQWRALLADPAEPEPDA